jgi:arginine/ornithine N-succinyltransferase beta subunit
VLATDREYLELGIESSVASYVLTRQSLSRFRAVVSRRDLVHDSSPLLTAQLEAFRVVEGQSGLRPVSSDPWEVLRAAAWAVHAAETAGRGSPRVW